MVEIPVQSGAGVTVAMPPPSSAGREEEIMAPESLGGGGLGSPVWFQLEEEGATPVLADIHTKTGPLAERVWVRTRWSEHPDQEGDSSVSKAAPEGSQEWAIVLASRPSRSMGGAVTELVWPDSGRSGDHQEEKLWGFPKRSGESACG
jgi:hypothetical protein